MADPSSIRRESLAMACAYCNDIDAPNPIALAAALRALAAMVQSYDRNAMNDCGILANDPRTLQALALADRIDSIG